MGEIADQRYLRDEQYKDASNLSARMRLHARCSTNSYGWHPWVFDQLELPAACRILELGCGSGMLWRQNLQRLPPGWEITLSDFSPGMLEEARRQLAASPHQFQYQVIDAQSISYPEATFDAVIANHMLYHVPDRRRALAEIRRVLRPGAPLYAATTGPRHMAELWALVRRFAPTIRTWKFPGTAGAAGGAEPFSLANGGAELARHFAEVTLRRYDDGLVVDEAEPLVDFVLSGMTDEVFDAEKAAALRRFIEAEIVAGGPFRITKDTGMFVAR